VKFFKKSKQNLETFKKNAKIFFHDFRTMQHDYFVLLFKKNKTEIEQQDFKRIRRENFRLSIFIACWLAPVPLIGTLYFILVPKMFWPMTLKKVLNV